MSLQCIFFDGNVVSGEKKGTIGFSDIKKKVEEGMDILRPIPVSSILDFLNYYSKMLLKDPEAKTIDGIAFLSKKK